MMELETLRLAEAFFARKPEALPSVRAFLLGALERWPESEIVTQASQVGLRDPRPYCALTAPGKRVKGRAVPGALRRERAERTKGAERKRPSGTFTKRNDGGIYDKKSG